MILRIFLSLIIDAVIVTSVKGQSSFFRMSITHMVGNDTMQREKNFYTPANEPYSISRFRYFLSNFALLTTEDKYVTLAPAYFLIDESKPASKIIELPDIPSGKYKGIRFLLGVDSIRNVSGPQSGALAVESGMFWSWNSGYIMAQIEGHSPLIQSPTREFVFHVGGYKARDQILKYISLRFPENIELSGKQDVTLQMTADLNKWFLPDTIRFQQQPVIMAPSYQAKRIAANYQHMFQIIGIQK